MDADFRAFVEGQLHARPIHDEDVALKHAGSPKVVRWVTRNSELADGTRPWRPIQMAATVDRRIAAAKSAIGRLLGYFASRTKDAWVALRSGLLRALSGCCHREIGMRANRHASTASRDVRDHLRLMRTSEPYGRIASRLVAGLLAAP